MATIDNYTIKVDVQGEQAIEKLKSGITGLGTAIAGIGFAAFANGVLQMADAVSDLSAATGLSIGNIAAFGGALGQAGGKADDASKMIGKFFQTLDEAAQGSDKAQEALQRVGFKLSDLTTMSEGQLLTKALEQLSQMEAGAKRTALGVEIFGKSFKSIDPKVLADAFATGDFSKAEQALKQMGDLADKLSANMHTLQIAGAQVFSEITTALEPFIGKVEEGRLSLGQAEKIIKTLGIGLAIAFGVQTVTSIVATINAIKLLTTALRGTVVVQAALTALSGPKGWAIIAGGAVAATAAIYGLNKALEGTNEEIAKATGGGAATDTKKTDSAYDEVKLSAKDKAANQAAVAAQNLTAQMKLQNDEANKLRQTVIATVGMESTYAGYIKNNADARAKATNDIKELEGKITLEKQKGEESNPRVIAQYREQITLKQKQLGATLQLNKAEFDAMENQQRFVTGVNTNAMLASRQADLDLIKQQIQFGTAITLEDQTQLKLMALANEETKKRIDLTKELKLAEASGNNVAIDDIQLRMSEDAKYYAQKRQLENEAAQAQIARREDGIAGAKTAIESITRSLDPFQQAQMQINSLWSNMTSAIDKFVETGKFSFSDFAKSVIQDMIKIELKAQASKLLGGITGGGLFSSIGSLLGLASGGPVDANTPYIVGEKGPELFVPPSAGKIIPNNKISSPGISTAGMNAPVTYTYVTNNNVSAIDAKSVAQFFAENRKTMLGSVQLAQKELPYGNR